MVEIPNLELLERDAFRKFYGDGLMDVFFGLMLATMAIGGLVTGWFGSELIGILVMLGAALLLVTVLLRVRRRLLRARLGEFSPGPERRRKVTRVRMALLGSVVVGLIAAVLLAAFYREDVSVVSIDVLVPLLWFVNAVVVMAAMAAWLNVPRFYVYGFLFGLAMPLLVLPDVFWDVTVPAWAAFGAPAVVMVAVGLFKLRRFLRDYPVLAVGGAHGDL